MKPILMIAVVLGSLGACATADSKRDVASTTSSQSGRHSPSEAAEQEQRLGILYERVNLKD